jgi:hypothetical protein
LKSVEVSDSFQIKPLKSSMIRYSILIIRISTGNTLANNEVPNVATCKSRLPSPVGLETGIFARHQRSDAEC